MPHFLCGNNIKLESISLDHISDKYISWFHDKDIKHDCIQTENRHPNVNLVDTSTMRQIIQVVMFVIKYNLEHIGVSSQ